MDKTCEQVFENGQLSVYEEQDKPRLSLSKELEDDTYEAERDGCENKFMVATPPEEQRGSQGMGTDRDGPFTTTSPIDYAWAYTEKKSIPLPKKSGFEPSKNYYCEIESFAESIGFHMSQSNGVYTLTPTRPNPTSNHKEVEQFKRDHPEYRNMKGTQARNKTNGIFNNYKGDCKTIDLEIGFRHRRMLEWLDMAKLNSKFRDMLRYLKRNHYRKVTDKQITKKNEEFTTTFVAAAKEMGYLEASFNKKGKLCYQLTEKGREYVRNI